MAFKKEDAGVGILIVAIISAGVWSLKRLFKKSDEYKKTDEYKKKQEASTNKRSSN